MPDTRTEGYLSIGEVLGLLLEEFPDVTISKIRFLESQGLISPERTASGYRKFYDDDVQLLRVILNAQQENYLPLRVIKDRLDSGEIDPTGEHLRPGGPGTPNGVPEARPAGSRRADLDRPLDDDDSTPAEIPASSIRSHPASRRGRQEPPTGAEAGTPQPDHTQPARADRPALDVEAAAPVSAAEAANLLPGVMLDRRELCAMVGLTDAELADLEAFGIVSPKRGSGPPTYGDDAVAIARPAVELLRSGLDARHLRNWRTSAEREASLFEQLVAPRFRQRNPEARADALAQLRSLDVLGAQLRAALTRHALRHHFES